MSFSQFLKDLIDVFNNFYDSCSGQITALPLLQFILIYLGKSTKFLLEYIVTCRWLIDFCSITVTVPKMISSNLLGEYSLEKPLFRFFDFFEIANRLHNPYIEGLLNSFFYCLPFSTGNILFLRRVTIEGIPGGFATIAGILSANFFIVIGILFGFRFIIFPWLSFELVQYVISVILIFALIERIAMKPLMRVKMTQTDRLSKIFFFHLGLTLTEQTLFLPYLANLSFTQAPIMFEGFDMGNKGISISFNPIVANLIYIFSVLAGMIFWYMVFGGFFIWLGNISTKIFKFTYSHWVQGVHRHSMLLIITISIISLPYYSGDFLSGSTLGFIPYDEATKKLHTKVTTRDYKKGRLGELSIHSSIDTDPSPFDYGRYTTGEEIEMTFEDLNYQGEYIWRTRNDRLAIGSKGLVNRWLRKLVPLFERKSKSKRKKPKTILPPPIAEPENDWDLFDPYALVHPIYAPQEEMIKRFVRDYQCDQSLSTFPDKEPAKGDVLYVPFSELGKYGFEAFANTLEQETDEFEKSLGKRVKNKYLENYVYRNFINFDIPLLLTRQPKKQSLNGKDENILFKKRKKLADYYDTIRAYSKLPHYRPYIDLFLGTKSYANRVYNQQFKGTLKIVKRLFSLTLENPQNLYQNAVLKYDQPLYTEKRNKKNRMVHEELLKRASRRPRRRKQRRPFLEEVSPIPTYAGWDNEKRKFSIINFTLNNLHTNIATNFYQDGKLYFLTWPIPNSQIKIKRILPKPPLNLLFNAYDDPQNAQERDLFEYPVNDKLQVVYDTLPSSVRRIDSREKEKILQPLEPLRGGYVWAMNDPFRIKIKEDLLDYLPPNVSAQIRIWIKKFK